MENGTNEKLRRRKSSHCRLIEKDRNEVFRQNYPRHKFIGAYEILRIRY